MEKGEVWKKERYGGTRGIKKERYGGKWYRGRNGIEEGE